MKIAIFPAGRDGKRLYKILKNIQGVTVPFLVDNNPNLLGEYKIEEETARIISPYRLRSCLRDGLVDLVLVTSTVILSYGLEERTDQLDALGITDYKVVPVDFLRKEELDGEDCARLEELIFHGGKRPRQLQHLQFHVADNCNLNCRRCQHFSNLVKEDRFPDAKSVRADLERLSQLFDQINAIAILGGEPLLNPELPLYCEMTRELFPYARIEIRTNGILLRRMPERLIKAVKDNRIVIGISYYPALSPSIDDIADFLADEGILCSISKRIETFSKKMTLSGSGGEDTFKTCRDRCCTTLRDGRLYPCYLPATIPYFNEEYGCGIEGRESSIDIYDEGLTAFDILDRLREGFAICRYCTREETCRWEAAGTRRPAMDDWLVG